MPGPGIYCPLNEDTWWRWVHRWPLVPFTPWWHGLDNQQYKNTWSLTVGLSLVRKQEKMKVRLNEEKNPSWSIFSSNFANFPLEIWGRESNWYLWSDADLLNILGLPDTSVDKEPGVMWETWLRSLGWENPLEKWKSTHSSILAWRIPWTA